MKEIIITLSLLILTIGCKSYEFRAKNKSELAELCSKEFPEIELERKTDTIYEDREVLVPYQIDCDTIGQKQVEIPIKWRDRIVRDEIKVRDTSKDFLLLMLEADKVNLERETKRLTKVISDEREQHKAEVKQLEKEHKKELHKANSFKRKAYWILGILTLGAGLILYFRR